MARSCCLFHNLKLAAGRGAFRDGRMLSCYGCQHEYEVSMGRKNYLRELEPCRAQRHRASKISWREYFDALLGFVRKPKTRFDLKDRGRLLILLVLVIILLQKVVEYFSN